MLGSICKPGGTATVLLPHLTLLILIQIVDVTSTRFGYRQQFIQLDNSYLRAEVGDDVELECKLDPKVLDLYPDIKLEWIFRVNDYGRGGDTMHVIYSTPWDATQPDTGGNNTENKMDGTRVRLTRNLYTLYLNRIRPDQEGTYICKVSNKELEVTEEVLVDVRLPKKVDNGEIITYDVDQNVKLVCVDMEERSKGEVSGNVIWRKNGEIVADNPELKLFRVDKDGEGEYHCIVEGSIERNVTVKVDISPKVFMKSTKVLQHPGYPAKLACSVHSSQVPRISWYKEEKMLVNFNETSSELKEITNMTFINEITDGGIKSILEFENVTLSSYGLYTCNATTAQGMDSKEIRLMYSATPVFERTSAASLIIPNIVILIIPFILTLCLHFK